MTEAVVAKILHNYGKERERENDDDELLEKRSAFPIVSPMLQNPITLTKREQL